MTTREEMISEVDKFLSKLPIDQSKKNMILKSLDNETLAKFVESLKKFETTDQNIAHKRF